MKYFVLCLVCLFSGALSLQAQSKKAQKALLLQDLETYKTYTLAQDFEKSLQFVPVQMFAIFPRDSMLKAMQQSMDNEVMQIELTSMNYHAPQKVKVKKAGEYFWALVPYDAGMRMVVKQKEYLPMLLPAMKAAFGPDHVKEEENGMVIQLTDKFLIAFKDKAASQWFFVEDKRKSKEKQSETEKGMQDMIIPDEVKKAIGI